MRRATALIMSGLLMSTWPVVAEEYAKGVLSARGSGAELILNMVTDAELEAIYGKGYQGKTLNMEVAVPVILWDEGKRKGPIHGTRTEVVSHGRSDISRQGVERQR
jgi:hypothetical protein